MTAVACPNFAQLFGSDIVIYIFWCNHGIFIRDKQSTTIKKIAATKTETITTKTSARIPNARKTLYFGKLVTIGTKQKMHHFWTII